jgi:hypothetical protein
MALVLVEGEDKLPGLVGNSTSNTSTAGQAGKKDYWTTTLMAIAATLALVWL